MKKILVAVDGSAASKNAAEKALVNVDYVTLSDSLIKLKEDRQRSMLDAFIESLDSSGVTIKTMVTIGNPHPEIVDTAENGDYDLIVMGHRGMNPVKRLFLGSVAKRVIEDAPCSVLIVR